MANSSSPLVFKVQRGQPELIRPAQPTPHEFKQLSDIDDQQSFRFHIPVILFYKKNDHMQGNDPVKVIREAIAAALVYYYPFAGRLREGPNRKLTIECTGEGVLFVEADAHVRLEQLGDPLQPPFPCLEDLLYDAQSSFDFLNCPLLLIQVTRLICGGFIFSVRHNHTVGDAAGLVQFLSAVGEIAKGASIPSIEPVWNRELLNAREPPCVTCVHHEVSNDEIIDTLIPSGDLSHRSFFFGPKEFIALRSLVSPHLGESSTFELLSACLWRCRTVALGLEPNDEVRLLCTVSARSKFSLQLPTGYYGNVLATPAAVSTVSDLCQNPFGYAVQLVRNAKAIVTEEYVRSFADLMVIKGRPRLTLRKIYVVTDVRRVGFSDVDFGCGKAVYGGPANTTGNSSRFQSFYLPIKNDKGENGVQVPVSLPEPAMIRFVTELDKLLRDPEISQM